MINSIESTFQTKVLFSRIKYHNNFPGVTNGIRSFAIDTNALFKVKDTVPDGVTINGNRFYLTFLGMVKKCFRCGEAGHVKKDCDRSQERGQRKDPAGDPSEGHQEGTQTEQAALVQAEEVRNEGMQISDREVEGGIVLVDLPGSPSDSIGDLSEEKDREEASLTLPTPQGQRLDTPTKNDQNSARNSSPPPSSDPTQPVPIQPAQQHTPFLLDDSPSKYSTPPMKPIKNYEAAVQSFNRNQQSTPQASLFPQDISTMINQFRRNTANPNNDPLKDPLAFPEIQDEDREVSFSNTNLTKKTICKCKHPKQAN